MKFQLVRSSHSVGGNFWSLEWCTKYRYEMMRKHENRKLVEAAIRQAAHRHKIKILKINVQPEHVHMVAMLPKGMNDITALRLLKGYSAWKIFQAKPDYRLRYPRGHFWSKGYYSFTVGYADLETACKYVEKQDEHHGTYLHGNLRL